MGQVNKFLLRLNFQGLCTFVVDGGRAWVFLVKAPARKNIPVHAGFLRIPADHLVKKAPGNIAWRLAEYDIRFSPRQVGAVNFICFDPVKNACSNPEAREDSCFSHVSSIASACAARGFPAGADIDPRFVVEDHPLRVKDAKLLSARFLLTGGRIGVVGLAGWDGQLIESSFRPFVGRPLDTDHRQVTAISVFWETEVIGDSVTIEAFGLSSGRLVSSLTLSPLRGKVEFSVLNEEADIILGMSEGSDFKLGIPRERDRIVESIFKLCSDPPPEKERPIPVPERLIPLPHAGFPIVDGSPPCEPDTLLLRRS